VCVPKRLGYYEEDDDDGDRFHEFWWSIILLVRLDLTKAILHCSIFHGLVAAGQASISIPFAKDLEHRDQIFPGRKVGIDIVGHAEFIPVRTMIFHGVGTLFCNSFLDAFIDKADIRAQCTGLRR
jgi:hypothetical protein